MTGVSCAYLVDVCDVHRIINSYISKLFLSSQCIVIFPKVNVKLLNISYKPKRHLEINFAMIMQLRKLYTDSSVTCAYDINPATSAH